jgi:hypothetical protein
MPISVTWCTAKAKHTASSSALGSWSQTCRVPRYPRSVDRPGLLARGGGVSLSNACEVMEYVETVLA